jgi:hypothetical protein
MGAGRGGYAVSLWAGLGQAEMGSFRHFFYFRHTGLVVVLYDVDISVISLFRISDRRSIPEILEHNLILMGEAKK